LRIIGLKAENIKRLKAIDLTPNDHINRISGGNGSGKTSLLDAIEWALTGTSTVPSQPVRKGSGKATVKLDLGDIIVTRRFTEGGSRNGVLVVEPKDGNTRFQGAQSLLDSYMGKISFDPLEFLRMHPKKQLEVLRSLVKLEIDLDELDREYQADYLRRRELKKEKTAVETRRDAIAVLPNLPSEKIDEAALVRELRETSDHNADIQREEREREEFSDNLNRLSRDIDDQRAKVAELRAQADALETEADLWFDQHEKNANERSSWKPLPELRNATELAEQIDAARRTNHGIDRRTQRESYQYEAEEMEAQIVALSTALDAREAAKTEALTKAEFPVPGLAFGEDEVIYRGFPFGQGSNAEQIRCSVAIGMASNPELRVMRIKDGSLLDDKAMEILAEMCQAHDQQLFMEVVDTSGKIGVYLEDGEVSAINEEPLNLPKAERPAPKKRAKKIPATA
jgi:AAA domain